MGIWIYKIIRFCRTVFIRFKNKLNEFNKNNITKFDWYYYTEWEFFIRLRINYDAGT